MYPGTSKFWTLHVSKHVGFLDYVYPGTWDFLTLCVSRHLSFLDLTCIQGRGISELLMYQGMYRLVNTSAVLRRNRTVLEGKCLFHQPNPGLCWTYVRRKTPSTVQLTSTSIMVPVWQLTCGAAQEQRPEEIRPATMRHKR